MMDTLTYSWPSRRRHIILLILLSLNSLISSEPFITSEKHRKYRSDGINGGSSYDAKINNNNVWSINANDSTLNQTMAVPLNFHLSQSKESLAESIESLSSFLQNFANTELGVPEAKKFYEASFKMARKQGLEEEVKYLGNIFSSQIQGYQEAVERLVSTVRSLSLYNESLQLEKCCDLRSDSFTFDSQYNLKIRKDVACWSAGSKSKSDLFVPSLFTQAMLKNSAMLPLIKWQYFISPEGIYVEYPANSHNCKTTLDSTRQTFRSKTHPERKLWLIEKSKKDSRIHRIVFLIQLGQNPSNEIIKSMKNIVIMLLRFLDEADEVGIINVDPDEAWTDFLCDQLVPVTPWTRYQILSYLNLLGHRYKYSSEQLQRDYDDQQSINPSLALNKSVQMACANFSSTSLPPSAATIIHLTAELNTNSTQEILNSPCPIFIESYILQNITKEEESIYKNNLQNVASKNVWNIQVNSMNQLEPESFAIKVALKLNSKKEWWSLSDILSQFFPDEKEKSTHTDFSLPLWNPVSKEPVIVAKKYVFENGHPLGLVIIEIPVIYFTQHITYYLNKHICNSRNYAFLIDTEGRVIAHPALGKPGTSEEVLSPIQIEQVEVTRGFSTLHQRLLSPQQPTGCHSLPLLAQHDWVTYAWSRVDGYIVVIVEFGTTSGCVPDREEPVIQKSFLSPKSDIQHHFLIKKKSCCGNREFNTDKAALYLSPSAFSKPASGLNARFSQSYNIKHSMALMAYLGDNSGLLQNQNKGLLPSVKDHVGILSNIIPFWKNRYQTSIWSKYIQRRFASGGGGSFLLMHPGISVLQSNVPQSSSWFRQGVKGNGDLMFTPPVINSRGSPISSLSIGVKVKVSSDMEVPFAILGATVTIGFFQKLIEEIVPACKNSELDEEIRNGTIRCFLIDTAGYVLYHPNLARSLQNLPLVHITQIEPLSVIDILQNTGNSNEISMIKHTCHKLSDTSSTQESLQRFYEISIGPNGIQKQKHGEMCNWYQILPIPKTNIFFGFVQDNCSSAAAFCPCSTVDNLCLNCLRIEYSDCECPCECPIESNFCAKQGFTNLPNNVEPCEFPTDTIQLDGSSCEINTQNQSSCNLIDCENIEDQRLCIGVYDCVWCEKGCTTFQGCYDFLKEKAKADDNSLGMDGKINSPYLSVNSKQDKETQITIVPILGILAIFVFFLGLVGYCYRHRALRSTTSQPDVHLLPLQDSPMGSIVPQAGSSPSNSDNDEPIPVPLLYRRHRRLPHQQPVRPRSPLGSVFTESDNGYSTMTHNDDSEVGAPIHSIDLLHPSSTTAVGPTPITKVQEPWTTLCNLSTKTNLLTNISVPDPGGDHYHPIEQHIN